MHILILLIFAICQFQLVFSQLTDEELVANVEGLGKIRGYESKTTYSNRTFIKYHGIPYGITQRFGASDLWDGILTPGLDTFNATELPPDCPQPFGLGDEDCLFLNIATHDVTNTSDSNLRPVIVFIHGAAFISGNSRHYTGDYLLKRDVVIVSFNYRLGVMGFFCLNTETVPCNGALYDAIAALKWVQKYIRYFGGDPNQVTLAGQSSGSTSVSHILLSPLADGLFSKAIALSGSALNEWALAKDPERPALRVAELCNCYNVSDPVIDLGIIENCMKNASQGFIANAQILYQMEEISQGRLGFDANNPAVQDATGLGSTPPFLTDLPINILNRGDQIKVPLMTGATAHDGAFGLVMLLEFYLIPMGNLHKDPEFLKYQLIPLLMGALGIPDSTGGLYETISRTYLGDTRLSGNFTQMIPGLVDMASVFFFKSAQYKTAQLHSRVSPVYFYSFDFSGNVTNHGSPIDIPYPEIVAHADDLIYLFPTKSNVFDEREQKISDTMIDYWVNFVTTGEPSKYPDGVTGNLVEWPIFNETSPKYLQINDVIKIDDDYPGTWSTIGQKEDPTTTMEPITSTTNTITTTTTEQTLETTTDNSLDPTTTMEPITSTTNTITTTTTEQSLETTTDNNLENSTTMEPIPNTSNSAITTTTDDTLETTTYNSSDRYFVNKYLIMLSFVLFIIKF